MKFMRIRKRHSRGWWGVFGIALLATGIYVAFDILDVDGSDLRSDPAQHAAVAEPIRCEIETEFRSVLATPPAQGFLLHPLAYPFPLGHPRPVAPYASRPGFARRASSLARTHLDQHSPSTAGTSDDPA